MTTRVPPPGAAWIVTLESMGHVQGPRFLDGRTQDGSVGLAGTTDPPFTGTQWMAIGLVRGVVILQCLGDIEGPRFLDGRTLDGSVGLAQSTGPPFSGTKWKIAPAGDGIVTLWCLGD